MKKRKSKIKDTEKRLQFTIVLGMFFPVLMQALFNLSEASQSETSGTILKAGLLVSFLIFNYLLFEWRKNSISVRYFDYLNWCYFSTITCYALIFLFLALTANGNIESINWFTWIFFPSILVGAMYIPLISIAFIVVEFLYRVLHNSFYD